MVTIVAILAGLGFFYVWLTGWWFASIIAAPAAAFVSFALAVNFSGEFLTITAATIAGFVVGAAPVWIRYVIRENRRTALSRRDASFETFGSRILNDLAPPTTSRRD
jgi:hypothetical protein